MLHLTFALFCCPRCLVSHFPMWMRPVEIVFQNILNTSKLLWSLTTTRNRTHLVKTRTLYMFMWSPTLFASLFLCFPYFSHAYISHIHIRGQLKTCSYAIYHISTHTNTQIRCYPAPTYQHIPGVWGAYPYRHKLNLHQCMIKNWY